MLAGRQRFACFPQCSVEWSRLDSDADDVRAQLLRRTLDGAPVGTATGAVVASAQRSGAGSYQARGRSGAPAPFNGGWFARRQRRPVHRLGLGAEPVTIIVLAAALPGGGRLESSPAQGTFEHLTLRNPHPRMPWGTTRMAMCGSMINRQTGRTGRRAASCGPAPEAALAPIAIT